MIVSNSPILIQLHLSAVRVLEGRQGSAVDRSTVLGESWLIPLSVSFGTELARDHLQQVGGRRVVAGVMSPVHDAYGKKGLVAAEHRCEMARRAASTSDWIHVSDWESRQDGWSRTAVSLRHHSVSSFCSSSASSLFPFRTLFCLVPPTQGQGRLDPSPERPPLSSPSSFSS